MQKIYILITIIILSASCTNNKIKPIMPVNIIGLASPIRLLPGKTEIVLADYLINPDKIDSVKVHHSLSLKLSEDKSILTLIKKGDDLPKISSLKIWISNVVYSILIMDSEKIIYEYSFNPKNKKYRKVQIAGEFNSWNPQNSNLEFKDGKWRTSMYLLPGKYQYQIIINGKWKLDPDNPDSVDNNIGGFNSVMLVGNNNSKTKPALFTFSKNNSSFIIKTENKIEQIKVFWQNFELDRKYYSLNDSELKIKIPKISMNEKRSFIRVWTANKEGISNDVLIPLENGKIISKSQQLTRSDKENMIIYNIMVDRFKNGNSENDEPVDNPDILPQANHHGGDIAGITKVLKSNYFSDLGINTLWISPIVQNTTGTYGEYPDPYTKFSSYHGYWPVSFTEIDYRFGTSEEFKQLVDETHKIEMNILLDFVANHVHEEHPVYKANKDWATNLYLPDGTLNIEKWDEHRLTTWFDTFLPTLDLENPEITEMLTDSAIFWLREYNLDGFRHDATKHIPLNFWRTLTRKIKQQVVIPQNKNIYQIGETYGSPELIASYIGSGLLDGQFDFNTYDAAVASFVKKDESFTGLAERLETAFRFYGYHHLMGNISDNQDRARFMAYADGSIRFDEDTKKAGWTRKIEVKNKVAYKKMAMLQAFNMTIPGIPVIFYGDEIGMTGGNDPDNRRMMRFENLKPEETDLKNTVSRLTKLRKQNLQFVYGDTKILLANKYTFAYLRSYFENYGIVVFNKDIKSKTIEIKIPKWIYLDNLKVNFNSVIKITTDGIQIKMEANTFEIITN